MSEMNEATIGLFSFQNLINGMTMNENDIAMFENLVM